MYYSLFIITSLPRLPVLIQIFTHKFLSDLKAKETRDERRVAARNLHNMSAGKHGYEELCVDFWVFALETNREIEGVWKGMEWRMFKGIFFVKMHINCKLITSHYTDKISLTLTYKIKIYLLYFWLRPHNKLGWASTFLDGVYYLNISFKLSTTNIFLFVILNWFCPYLINETIGS